MKILVLAPHPFFQERGTPIAVKLLLQEVSGQGHAIDLLTYHEGDDVDIPGVTLHRIRRPLFARNVPPGPSLKKIICDLVMWPKAMVMARHTRYDVIHAVEESVYMAMAIRRRHGIPYIYDMDSSLARQISEKFPFLGFCLPLLTRLESAAIRGALAVVPVCDALADIARTDGARKTILLRDISLLTPSTAEDIKAVKDYLIEEAPIETEGELRFMYIGNLETYQGMDLMLDAFALFLKTGTPALLLIAGGKAADIKYYRQKALSLGITSQVRFMGPQPISRMAALFDAADILVSPRIKGNNTPMKIYSYLASGKPILATALPTHTQVLTPGVALLASAEPQAFADAMGVLAGDAELRTRLGHDAQALAEQSYSREAFRKTVDSLYMWVATAVANARIPAP